MPGPMSLVNVPRHAVRSAVLALAMIGLAGCETGMFDLALEPPQNDSLGELRELALAGDAGAQTALGQRYEHGIGIPADRDAAFAWYERAASQGDPLGQYLLGQMYEDDMHGAPDHIAAAAHYMRAAGKGLPSAQAALGRLYEYGYGVPQSYDQAARWYALAAIQWDAGARYPLGAVYATGTDIHFDAKEALKWYERAAALGVAEAQFDLGRAFELGKGVGQDPSAAQGWYREAAEQGHERAAEALARLYGLAPEATPAVGRSVGERPPVLDPPAMTAREPDLPAIDPPRSSTEPLRLSPPAPPKASPPEPEPMPSTIVAAAEGDFMVHLASYRKIADADAGWGALMVDHSDLLGDLEIQINRVNIPDKGVFYRLQAGPLVSMTAATQLCRQLEARETYCNPVGSDQ